MRKITAFILVTLTLSNITFGQVENDCACENYYTQVLKYSDAKNQIIVCGTKSDDDSLIYEITVYDCMRDTLLFDNKFNEIFPHSIRLIKGGFSITDYHFAPMGDDWKQSKIPFTETQYKFDLNNNLIQTEKLIFNYPELTNKQLNDIKDLCDKLNGFKGKLKGHYPLDYETIYILFVGAYKDVYSSRQLFLNLEIFFEFDGAAAETLREISIERLIDR
jgi:hypothetical protein